MFSYDAIQLFDLGYGPRLIPVTPPDCTLSLSTSINPKHRGKAPGLPTMSGWVGLNLNDAKRRCLDYATAKLWRDEWGANLGFVAGDGFVVVDNDQGELFSRMLRAIIAKRTGQEPLRRHVADPKHTRDAFLIRVVDEKGDPVDIRSREMKLRKGVVAATVQLLGHGKQFVIAGVHPETRSPYVWERELPPLDQIPTLDVHQYDELQQDFYDTVAEEGWDFDTQTHPVSAVRGNLGGNPSNSAGNNIPPLITQDIQGLLTQAQTLLDKIPNREVPLGTQSNAIDDWLDAYENWIKVAYALIAFLGAAAHSPEALALWVAWSDGRAQSRQTSESVWRSALGQPSTQFGSVGLVHIVRQFDAPEPPDFPDIDPDDEMLAAPSLTPIWDQLKRRWAFSKAKGFIDMQTGRACAKVDFADGEAYRVRALCRELRVPFKGSPSAASLFLRQPDRVEVFDITYAPGDPVLVPSKDPGMPSFNRWRATAIPAEPVGRDSVQRWLDHLTFVLGSDQERDRFLRWSAFVAQHPKVKPNWHFLVLSEAGVGKDTMTAPLKLAVGTDNHVDIASDDLAEPFNGYWVENKLVIVGEFTKSKRDANEVANRLKRLLAAPPDTLIVNQKNLRQYEIPNRTAVVMFSNNPNPLYLERGSRRVHVVNRLKQKRRDDAYYLDMVRWLDNGGAASCAAYLLTLPLTDAEIAEFKGVAPVTSDKLDLEEQNVDPGKAALEDLIRDAREGFTADTPGVLVASAEELSGFIELRPGFKNRAPTARVVSAWLMAMPDVQRIKIDPKHPNQCGVVTAIIAGVKYCGRLWALTDTTVDGRLWSALSETEIISIWKNLGSSKGKRGSFVVVPGGKGKDYPDDDGEEPV
jgi:hypothetical protein